MQLWIEGIFLLALGVGGLLLFDLSPSTPRGIEIAQMTIEGKLAYWRELRKRALRQEFLTSILSDEKV